jgi:hypothetical protein
MVKNIQAYEKTSDRQEANDDKNCHHGEMLTGSSVVIIIITAHSLPPPFEVFQAQFDKNYEHGTTIPKTHKRKSL